MVEIDGVAGVHEREEPLTGKAATQERILAAATKLFLECGYERTTISHVAEEAKVSRATVFWHFSDKAGLFREAFNRLAEPFRRSLDRDFSDLDPEKRLEQQIALYQSFVSLQHEAVSGFLRWAIESEPFRQWMVPILLDMHQRFGGVLVETIAELAPPEADAKRLATALLIAMDGDLFVSFFDASSRAGEDRRASVRALADLIPRRTAGPTGA